ncbi:hypothetical protein AB0J68_17480 [Micromonospora sp. NPDC049580]|uniref:hypothetical protein n=1 Tax=Micromonospora sp. NPDC049580 TaxID=3154832 RepID=UPI003414819B
MAVNMGRVWTIVDETLREDERGRVHASLVGVLLEGVHPMHGLRDKAESPDRDVLYVTDHRLVFVLPKLSKHLRLRDSWKLARGDLTAVARVISIPREGVVSVECPSTPPSSIRVFDATFLRINTNCSRGLPATFDFWIDLSIKKLGGFTETISAWTGRSHP